ncbi:MULTISPECIES: hypothetical protein [Methylobacterium]|nr:MULTISPECIES: hypothetical protein [Methylobacterium]TXN21316.1 hypothetical protein FV217_14670 [Methylobacterium sp. WL9]
MSTWTATVLGLWAAYWAALFAQVAHLRMRDDGAGALAFGWLAGALLAAGTGFFVSTIGA